MKEKWWIILLGIIVGIFATIIIQAKFHNNKALLTIDEKVGKKYEEKIKDLANEAKLTYEISEVKLDEAIEEVYSEERQAVIDRFMSNFSKHPTDT